MPTLRSGCIKFLIVLLLLLRHFLYRNTCSFFFYNKYKQITVLELHCYDFNYTYNKFLAFYVRCFLIFHK